VLEVYDHRRWRYTIEQASAKAWGGLATDDGWKDKSLRRDSLTSADGRFGVGQDAPAVGTSAAAGGTGDRKKRATGLNR
jgi:hypothetical protein